MRARDRRETPSLRDVAVASGGDLRVREGDSTVIVDTWRESLMLDIEQCGVSPDIGADLTVSVRVRQ